MSDEVPNRAYPFAVEHSDGSWSASALQWPAAIAAATRDELERLMAEQVALYLHDEVVEGRTPEPPKYEHQLNVAPYREDGEEFEVVFVSPAPLSSAAVAIDRALHEDGVSQAELARRMGVPRSTISRITDPLYSGHTTNTLRAVAEALGRKLRIDLVAADGDALEPQEQAQSA